MPPAILRLTVFSTMLLSSANAALRLENSARLLQAESSPGWQTLSIEVKPNVVNNPDCRYTMLAVPVLSEGGTKVLYDVSARLDEGAASCIDNSVASYRQTNGYAVVLMSPQTKEIFQCLDSESGRHMIPRINFMLQEVAGIDDGDAVISTTTCNEEHTITLSEKYYAVCVTKPGVEMTISGEDMLLTVKYAGDVKVTSNGGETTGCPRVSVPFEVREALGRSLLAPGH
uniref:Uncharacterized protein n=1 Tax=Peronospora matthiolae TaxID=2874970 RepID=A0AAV1UB85_9STRA